MINLPATYDKAVEIHGVPFACEEIRWFRQNKLPIFGITINCFDKADAQMLALETMKAVAMRDTPSMMAVVDYAKQGWGLAQEALKDILNEYDNHDVLPPPYLRAYRMDLVDGRVPHLRGKAKSDEFFRDIVIVVTIKKVCEKFGVNPTRSPASLHSCGISIVVAALRLEGFDLKESAVRTIWGKYKHAL